MRIKHLLLSIYLLVSGCVIAQQYSFTSLTTNEGLSQNDVNDILQDSRGFLWFATYDGLNKYDGYEFTTYQTSQTNPNAICGNLIHAIHEGENNKLWITTENSGLSRLDLLNDQIVNIGNTKETPNVFQTNRLGKFVYYSGNHMWLETQKGPCYLHYRDDGTFISDPVNKTHPVLNEYLSNRRSRNVFKASDSTVWLIGHGGISVVQLNSVHHITDIHDIQFEDNLFECAAHCPEGYLIGAISGLYLLKYSARDKQSYSFEKLSSIIPTDMIIDNHGQLWVGTTHGIFMYEHTPDAAQVYTQRLHFTTENSNLISHKIRCIYMDNSGILWFGTNGGGVSMLDQNKPNFRHYPIIHDKKNNQHNPKCTSIYEDRNGTIWLGTDNHGLFMLPTYPERSYTHEYFRFQPNANSLWHSIYFTHDVHTPRGNFIWAGCSFNNVLVEIDQKKWGSPGHMRPIKGIPEMCFQMIQDSDSLIWIASYWGGLYRYDPYKQQAQFHFFNEVNSDIPSNIARSVLEDDKGRIWVGTSHGLCRIERADKRKKTPRFMLFTTNTNTPLNLSHNYILPLRKAHNGTIWIGTMGGGLNKYVAATDSTPEGFISYTTENGFPNNVIKDIIEDNRGYLWISSNRGLTRFDPKTEKINNYDKNDGLQDNEFSEHSGCKLKNGEILFGGVNGFNAFYPEEIKEDTTLPVVALTHIEIQGSDVLINDTVNGRVLLKKHINECEHIELKHYENNIAIHFSGLHYSSPYKNQYKYYLQGFDKQWITTNAHSRFAKYTNLEPGKYTLKVLASNANNFWTDREKVLHIKIHPPYWKTWIFRISVVILSVLTLLALYRLRVRQLTRELHRRKEHERVLTIAKTKAEESDNLKSAIIANLSHEIRTPVNGIFGFSELLSIENLPGDKRKRYTKVVRQRCNDLTKVLDSVLLLSAAQSGTIKADSWERPLGTVLSVALAEAQDVLYAKKKSIAIRLVENDTDLKRSVSMDHHKVHYVLSSLLDNAIKFTDEGGIDVCCTVDNGMLHFYVQDTGIGIPEKNQKIIFEEFRQTSIGLSRQYGGIGLGLALCKTYVNLLGGKIWLNSTEGEGSTFHFTVPFTPTEIRG